MGAQDGARTGRPTGAAGAWRYRLASLRSLCARALASLRRRGLAPTLKLALRRLFPRPQAGIALRLLGDVSAMPLPVFPDVAQPRASIVVPVFDQLEATLRCLHALQRSGD